MVSAPTPPMGWNSWDCFGTTVTEAEVLANAQVMHDRLLPFGWDTVVVDIAWYDPPNHKGVAMTTIFGSVSIRAHVPGRGDLRYTRYPDGTEELYKLSTDPGLYSQH